MSDILKEAREDLKRERNQKRVKKLTTIFIIVAIATTVGMMASKWYGAKKIEHNIESASKFYQIKSFEGAEEKLQNVANSSKNAYREVANLRLAALALKNGDAKKALSIYDGMAGNSASDKLYRDLAEINAIKTIINAKLDENIDARLANITQDNAFYYNVIELKASNFINKNRILEARNLIGTALQDSNLPQQMADRLTKIDTLLGR